MDVESSIQTRDESTMIPRSLSLDTVWFLVVMAIISSTIIITNSKGSVISTSTTEYRTIEEIIQQPKQLNNYTEQPVDTEWKSVIIPTDESINLKRTKHGN